VEQYSIDEFFADVSGWVKNEEVYVFAKRLQEKIQTHYDIPVSIGISRAKWIAKLATKSAKPYGIYEVKDIDAYIEKIPIGAFPGIGRGFERRLSEHYIRTLGDLKRQKALLHGWKKPGIQLYRRVTGTDGEGIEERAEKKSIGISRTFDPIYDAKEVRRRIMIMARHICYMVMAIDVNPTTYYLKINYEGGIRVKAYIRVDRLFSEKVFKEKLLLLYREIAHRGSGAIKLTLNVSNFSSQHYKTLSLLDFDRDSDARLLSTKIQSIRERFGLDILKTANEL
jgi:DNA polymerase-4